MASRGIFGRALRTRWTRAAAAAGACVLAVQSARLPMMLTAERATCCCPHRTAEDACGCPVCAHRRLLESDHPGIEPCAAAAHAQGVAVSEAAVLPARTGLALPRGTSRSAPLVVLPRPGPAVDVPTPPPLARA